MIPLGMILPSFEILVFFFKNVFILRKSIKMSFNGMNGTTQPCMRQHAVLRYKENWWNESVTEATETIGLFERGSACLVSGCRVNLGALYD